MSYPSNGASRPESSACRKLGQGGYPQESANSVTPAMTVWLTTPQSGGWATRIGHERSLEQIQEQTARHSEYVDARTTQTTERKAQIIHSARKRKESPTKEELIRNRPRYTESTQTTLEVQASWKHSNITPVTQASRPITGSELIQHQCQPCDRTLMAHGKGSTGNSSDVLDVGKMAVSPQKAQVTASLMSTSRGIKVYDGVDIIQSLELKQGGRAGIE